jgi:tetratricopeptide (TPR) repeat protein
MGEIARGGMGVIVKLMDNDIRRPVAMKVILGHSDGEPLARFVEEAQVTGQLEHPNIVPVHELGLEADGRVFFTMKLVKGESLESIIDKIAEKNPEYLREYTRSHLIQIFQKICDAIAFAHSRGVIHRDLKPENVMVGKFGEVLVMDWGLAKVKGLEDAGREALVATIRSEDEVGRTMDGEVMGTPSYMPPEQATGQIDKVDARSDIFALGGILYRILTHEAPYTGESITKVMAKAEAWKLIAPRKRTPWNRIPAELESICLKAMAKEKAKRYASVEGMIADLRAHMDHRLVSAHRYGPLSRFARFVQRHPGGSLAGGVALLLITLGMGIVVSLTSWAREHKALAEAESLRADLAEREKDVAEKRADVAEDILMKGRAVSAVLRSAEIELGDVLREFESAFHSPVPLEKRREVAEKYWGRIETFEKQVKPDSASQAAWLAAKGWLACLGTDSETGLALFQRAREVDPDVAFGNLFEGMAWLAKYLDAVKLPQAVNLPTGVEFLTFPKETPELRKARENFETILGRVAKAKVWGETASKDFRAVLEGFRAVSKGDLARAEEGLTRGLAVAELVWLRRNILLARGNVRYLAKKFDDGLADVEKVLSSLAYHGRVLYLKNLLLRGKAAQIQHEGGDPGPLLEQAIEILDQLLVQKEKAAYLLKDRGLAKTYLAKRQFGRGEDSRPLLTEAIADFDLALKMESESETFDLRGSATTQLGRVLGASGEDPRPLYRKALKDFDTSLRLDPRQPVTLSNRGNLLVDMGIATVQRGGDPRDLYRSAIRDYTDALDQDPEYFLAFNNRSSARIALGMAMARFGEEPTKTFRKATSDASEALRLRPDFAEAYDNRGTCHYHLGEMLDRMRRDSREEYKKAIADCTEAIRRKPRRVLAYNHRGMSHRNLGDAQVRYGEDPAQAYEDALRDFSEALRINPEYGHALTNRGNVFVGLAQNRERHRGDPRDLYRKAVADFSAALEKNPSDAITLNNRGNTLYQLARAQARREEDPNPVMKRALADLEKALRIMPTFDFGWNNLGLCHKLLGIWAGQHGEDPRPAFRKAGAAFQKAAKVNPRFGQVWFNLGYILRTLASEDALRGADPLPTLQKSIDAYGLGLRILPEKGSGHHARGISLYKLGRFAEAAGAFGKANQILGGDDAASKRGLQMAQRAASAPPWAQAFIRGDEMINDGFFSGAVPFYEEGLKRGQAEGVFKDPKHAPAFARVHARLAWILSLASAGRRSRKGDPTEVEEPETLRARAIAHLRTAVEGGMKNPDEVRRDPGFAPLRDLPAFQALMKEWEAKEAGGK